MNQSPGLFDEQPTDIAKLKVRDLRVAPVPTQEGRRFVSEHHYTKTIGTGSTVFGLYTPAPMLVGVCAFATPISEDARAAVFGPDYVDHVTDLQRLVLLDEVPRNAESYFIVRALALLKRLRPLTWAVTSFADSTEGHVGTIYQATNAIYTGKTTPGVSYRDQATGALRPEKIGGVHIGAIEARDRGWVLERRLPKHRYVYLLPDDRAHRRRLMELLLLTPYAYPKVTS